MRKRFTGGQSGMFAWTARMIREVSPALQVSVWVEGLHAPSRQPLPAPLQGTLHREILQGYVRSLIIETEDHRHHTVGCEHAVEEDIAARAVSLVYYPEIDFEAELAAATPGRQDAELAASLARAIVAMDNTEAQDRAALAGFIERHGPALLSHPSMEVRRRFVLLMKQERELKEAAPLLLGALSDRCDEVRELALVDVAAFPEVAQAPGIGELLLKALERNNQNVRAYACEACGAIAGSEAAGPLRQILFDPKEHVREAGFVALHRLLQRIRIELDAEAREEILRGCAEALGRGEKGVLQAAALRLGFLVENCDRRLVAEVLGGLGKPLDLTAEDQSFRRRVFYRTTLVTLLANHAHLLTRMPEFEPGVRSALYALAEEMRALYEGQRKTLWRSYLRDYAVPQRKKRGQVFVNFAHSLAEFGAVVAALREELGKDGVHLFISKDMNPRFSENVLIPKVYRPIQESELMLVDISKHNTNVGYELGLAEKFNVPVTIVRSVTSRIKPFDFEGHFVQFEYDPRSPEAMARFKTRLGEHLRQAVAQVAASRADIAL